MAKKAFVRARLESLAPQRQQYRPYLFNLLPTDVYVEVEIDPDTVIETWAEGQGTAMVLNLDGFKALLTKLADAVDDVHDAYIIKARKSGKY